MARKYMRKQVHCPRTVAIEWIGTRYQSKGQRDKRAIKKKKNTYKLLHYICKRHIKKKKKKKKNQCLEKKKKKKKNKKKKKTKKKKKKKKKKKRERERSKSLPCLSFP